MVIDAAVRPLDLSAVLDGLRDDVRALRLGFEAVGVSMMDQAGRIVAAQVSGLPDRFGPHYARSGESIDPVLAHVRRTGIAASTTTVLGDDVWLNSRLYTTVSERYGLRSFACVPLVRGAELVGVANVGRIEDPAPIGFDALVGVATLAARISSRLVHERADASLELTARQREVVDLVADGCSNDDVARHLGISVDGVKKHLKTLNRRFGTRNRTALVSAVRGERRHPES